MTGILLRGEIHLHLRVTSPALPARKLSGKAHVHRQPGSRSRF
jgi:hypothetical protein